MKVVKPIVYGGLKPALPERDNGENISPFSFVFAGESYLCIKNLYVHRRRCANS